MKPLIFLFLFNLTFVLSAQNTGECGQLAIKIHGVVEDQNTNQLLLETSNLHYNGELFNYPGFILFNEYGDTIAMETASFYGIGSNFQVHRLNIKDDIFLPFSGYLGLFGSYYQKEFCTLPIEIDELDYVDFNEIQNKTIKIAPNVRGDQIILDLAGNHVSGEDREYHFNVTNEDAEVVYKAIFTENITAIPVEELDGSGFYIVSVWDEINKKLLPSQFIEID